MEPITHYRVMEVMVIGNRNRFQTVPLILDKIDQVRRRHLHFHRIVKMV